MWKQPTDNEACSSLNLGTFTLRSRGQVWLWAGGWCTEKATATEWFAHVHSHEGMDLHVLVNGHVELHRSLIFDTPKRFKSFTSKDISHRTPESFAAFFFFFFIPNMYFCKPAFPKQCKWIRSDCIDIFFFLNTCDFMRRNTPPTKSPQWKRTWMRQSRSGSEVSVGARHAINNS